MVHVHPAIGENEMCCGNRLLVAQVLASPWTYDVPYRRRVGDEKCAGFELGHSRKASIATQVNETISARPPPCAMIRD
jgi:hypothetical protein